MDEEKEILPDPQRWGGGIWTKRTDEEKIYFRQQKIEGKNCRRTSEERNYRYICLKPHSYSQRPNAASRYFFTVFFKLLNPFLSSSSGFDQC